MANEITMSASMTVSKGGVAISTGSLSKTLDMTGSYAATESQLIETANEALTFNTTNITGDVNVVVKNMDATNYVEIFKDSGNSHLLSKLKAGQSCLLTNVPAASLYARANGGSVIIQFWIGQA